MTSPSPAPEPRPRDTRQRRAIRELLDNTEEFRTAQQVHDDLRAAGETIGLATVYRTLQSLAEAGDVDSLRQPEGEMAYRRCSTDHHHHLICRNCGRTVEIAATLVEQWAEQVAAQHGYRDAGHELEMFGLCQNC